MKYRDKIIDEASADDALPVASRPERIDDTTSVRQTLAALDAHIENDPS